MSLEKFFTREVADTSREYLPESSQWWIKVRALNARERREREGLMVRENLQRPKTERAAKKLKESEYQESSLEYRVAAIKAFEYDHCLEDFVLPYIPAGSQDPVDFVRKGKSRDAVREFLDNIPPALEEFIEDAIARVNKEGKYAPEAEEVKNG